LVWVFQGTKSQVKEKKRERGKKKKRGGGGPSLGKEKGTGRTCIFGRLRKTEGTIKKKGG